MILQNIYDELFSRKSNIMVLRAMQHHKQGLSGRAVARAAGLAPKNCIDTLTHLESLGIISRLRGGREHFFSLNRENYLVTEIILPLLARESEFSQKVKEAVASWYREGIRSLILFGSTARGDETILSDFDLCIIANRKRDIERFEHDLEPLQEDLHRIYNISLSPILYSKREFVEALKKRKHPVKEIAEEGVVLAGSAIKELLDG